MGNFSTTTITTGASFGNVASGTSIARGFCSIGVSASTVNTAVTGTISAINTINTTLNSFVTSASVSTTNVPVFFNYEIVLTTSVSGVYNFQFGSEVLGSSVSLLAGSMMIVTQLN
jgi:hypothetical protein